MGGRVVSKFAVARYVARCVRREDSPRIEELAREMAVTPEHLSRAFHRQHGVTLSVFIKAQQVRRATRLLRKTRLSMTRIAYLCGFGTRRTFFRSFRRRMGLSPDQYRRMSSG